MKKLKHYIRAGLINFVAQIVFILLFYAFGKEVFPGDDLTSKVYLFLIILTPAVIWTGFFYLQDMYEPEPISYLFMAVLSGAALASLISIPVANEVFQINTWFYNSVFTLVWGSLIVYGMLFSAVVYIIIKFGYYPKSEFDEPIDGIIYGAFIGAGYAFVLSVSYLFSGEAFDMFNIAYVSSSNVMIYASTGGLIGSYLGKAKFFEKGNLENSIVSILIGALIVGVYHFLKESIFIAGFDKYLIVSLIITLAFSYAIFAVVFILMKKFLNSDYEVESVDKPDVEFITMMIVVVAIVTGLALKINEEMPGTFKDESAGISLKYSFRIEDENQDSLNIRTLSETNSKPIFQRRYKLAGKSPSFGIYYVESADSACCQIKEQNSTNVYPVNYNPKGVVVDGHKSVRLHYYYTKLESNNTEFPQIIYGCEDLIKADNGYFIFSYEAPSGIFYESLSVYQELLKSVKLLNTN